MVNITVQYTIIHFIQIKLFKMARALNKFIQYAYTIS